MWVVYDQKTLNYMVKEKGIDLGVGVMVPVTTKLTNFEKEWPAAEKAGWAVKASSLKELAKKTGMDLETLKASVKEYNGFAAVRHDGEFAKAPEYLRAVEKAPYYAIKMVATSLGTLGGIKSNEHFQVVKQDGTPIPGLYCAGNDVGGMYGFHHRLGRQLRPYRSGKRGAVREEGEVIVFRGPQSKTERGPYPSRSHSV